MSRMGKGITLVLFVWLVLAVVAAPAIRFLLHATLGIGSETCKELDVLWCFVGLGWIVLLSTFMGGIVGVLAVTIRKEEK